MTAANVVIKPVHLSTSHKTHSLINLSKEDIVRALGFEPNESDDPDKVENSWGFTIDGKECGIWDYKGSHMFNQWSAYDPHGVMGKIFSGEVMR